MGVVCFVRCASLPPTRQRRSHQQSLARLGAHTLGIDASASNVGIASLHASADPSLNLSSPVASSSSAAREGKGTLTYEHTSAEDVLAARGPGQFDVVTSMEVLEHVDNPRAFLRTCADLVKVTPLPPATCHPC